ncbi:hypothetical protein M422DRAFT_256415 [Sphaerobolus stellatus SS14]|uniref:Uncharacterized protein n=1 Tax=Sphaerobolus stellatus (strain SS14) TaxID=990650 RepID=A0A0C9V0W5_SPHS4|nr:hypothetical protein M422DRAFT_256415 [Sphaerobolus stellatus SS14]
MHMLKRELRQTLDKSWSRKSRFKQVCASTFLLPSTLFDMKGAKRYNDLSPIAKVLPNITFLHISSYIFHNQALNSLRGYFPKLKKIQFSQCNVDEIDDPFELHASLKLEEHAATFDVIQPGRHRAAFKREFVPSAFDASSISQLFEERNRKLEACNLIVEETRKKLDEIWALKKTLEDEYLKATSLRAPIRRLPDEILRQILINAIPPILKWREPLNLVVVFMESPPRRDQVAVLYRE